MKKLFLGLFVAGTMMSFTPVEKTPSVSDEVFLCTVEIRDGDGYLVARGSAESCERALEIATSQL